MIGSVAEKVGEFFGRLVKMRDGLEGLRNGFQKFFGEAKYYVDFEFSSELGDKLVTTSRCPIYRYMPIWCEKYCLPFARGFARVYGVENVRRVERQPESERCIFEFW